MPQEPQRAGQRAERVDVIPREVGLPAPAGNDEHVAPGQGRQAVTVRPGRERGQVEVRPAIRIPDDVLAGVSSGGHARDAALAELLVIRLLAPECRRYVVLP